MAERPLLLGFLFDMEGASARAAGIPINCNPYLRASEQHRRWQDGWNTSPPGNAGFEQSVSELVLGQRRTK
jgi:hypothetical protein